MFKLPFLVFLPIGLILSSIAAYASAPNRPSAVAVIVLTVGIVALDFGNAGPLARIHELQRLLRRQLRAIMAGRQTELQAIGDPTVAMYWLVLYGFAILALCSGLVIPNGC